MMLFREKCSGKTDLAAHRLEDALKQRRCLDALQEYFAEAQKTVALVRRYPKEPRSAAEHHQILVQRDREAEAQRRYLQVRKLLLHAAKVSCLPGKGNDSYN
jgi:HPt (histidine-containing phosphotransfer) domain-containing protein